MMDVKMGNAIAGKRKELGLTQEQLAECLGVTKAAVSKWEQGRSLPDVALVPLLASRLDLTLEELFAYEPQLSKEEAKRLSGELHELLASDAKAGIRKSRELTTLYWSCERALSSIAGTLSSVSTSAEENVKADWEDREAMANEAARVYERVEELCEDAAEAVQVRRQRAMVLHTAGRNQEAIELLEPLAVKSTEYAENMLAAMYYTDGQEEEAARVNRRTIAIGLQLMCAGLSSVAVFGAEEEVDLAYKVVEGLEGALSLSRFEGSIVWQLRLVKAVQLVKAGEADAGLDLLQGFAEAVVDYLETMCAGKPDVPALLDRSVFTFGAECPPELVRKGQESSRESLIKMFEHDRDLEPYHDDPRYQQALKALREWRAK